MNPSDYTLSGTTVTLDAALPSGRDVIIYSVRAAVSGSNLNHDQFTCNGNSSGNLGTEFTLSISPVSENNTQVFLDGVYQQKTDYSVSGTTLTMDTAPESGAILEVMTFTQTNINVPVNDTVDTVHLKADAVTAAKIADSAISEEHLDPSIISGLTSATAVSADTFMIFDATDNALKKASIDDVVNASTSIQTAADATAIFIDSGENVGLGGAADSSFRLKVNGATQITNNLQLDGNLVHPSGDLTLDVAGDINLDAGGANINFNDDGTAVGHIEMAGQNLEIKSKVADKDIILKGNDGGSPITALTLDMSEAGAATFNSTINTSGQITQTVAGSNYFRSIASSSGNAGLYMQNTARNWFVLNNSAGGFEIYDGTASAVRLGINTSGTVSIAGALSSGAITSSAGITAETGINLESGTLVIKNATGDSSGLRIFQDSSDASKIYNNFNGTLQLGVGNTTALTIDSSENATFAGTISSGAITSSASLKATDVRVNEGNSLAGGLFKEKAVTGTGSSNDLSIFAEGISNGGNIHFMTGGSATIRATIDSSGDAVFQGSGTFGGVVKPSSANAIDLGTNGTEFRTLYLDTSLIASNDLTISTGTHLNLSPATNIRVGNNKAIWSGSYGGALFLKGNNATSDRYARLCTVDSTGSAVNNGLTVTNTGVVQIAAVNNSYNFQAFATDSDSFFGVWEDANNSANIQIDRSDGATVFYVYGHTGNYHFAGSDTSDRDLKENIADVPDGSLALVKQLKPRTFNFKASEGFDTESRTGFIAQEVESIFTTAHHVATGTDGEKDMGVDTVGVVAHLTKALQEQQVIIDDLKSRIEALEG